MREIVKGWAYAELAGWVSGGGFLADFSARFDELNRHFQSIFIFDITPHGISVRSKNGLYETGQPRGSDHGFVKRVELYLSFFNRVLHERINKPFAIAVDTEDLCRNWTRTPVFSFQKEEGFTNILLPDVDFLANDFYQEQHLFGLSDDSTYETKKLAATFTGSTTGAGTITADKLDRNVVPRIRAARFFKNHEAVHFSLPGLVQCQDELVIAKLRGENLGTNRLSWKDQLAYRFLISMDGNGATCSRMYIALKSKAVPLKYESPHLLYYFRGLQPGVHYVNIGSDEDVLSAIRLERRLSGFHEPMAVAGTHFADNYLSYEAVSQYTVELFRLYSMLLSV